MNSSTAIFNEKKLIEQIINRFNSLANRLILMWNEFGLSDEVRNDRMESVIAWILTVMNNIENEEEELYKEVLEKIEKHKKEITELSHALQLPIDNVDNKNMGLLEKEKYLRTKKNELANDKEKRLSLFQEFRAQEKKLCLFLGMKPLEFSSVTGVPTENDLRELEQNVQMLKTEQETRRKKFCMAKRELTTILEKTELSPETSFERDVICYDDDHFCLSKENLKELDEFIIKIQKKKSEIEETKIKLLETLNILWDRISLSPTERENFLSKHEDLRKSTIASIENEIKRCNEVMRQNMKKFIEVLKKELNELWDKCFISHAERNEFLALYGNEYTEESLNAFEKEVQKMKSYYDEIANIIIKIEKRQKLWNLMLEMESKVTDPNRYTNRGGNLLQEEKERKRLQKDLPNLETELFELIEEYEIKYNKPFLYNGINFQQYINDQWKERLEQKENEKMMRHKLRSGQVGNESALITPQRKRCISTTPKSAPSKMLKTTLKSMINKTPVNNFRTPEIMKAKSKTTMTLRSRNNSPRYVMVQGNVQRKKLRELSREIKSSDETTYSKFANELNRSSRIGHRSSVLPSRKIICSKISKSINQRKSITKSKDATSKSIAKSPAKMTPARGKLGLPFLI